MSGPAQKSQAPATTVSPDQEQVETPLTPEASDATAPESAHQGATESDVTQIQPPVSGDSTTQTGNTVVEAEIDPTDEITPG